MQSRRFPLLFGAICLAAFSLIFLWQTPGLYAGRLTPAQVDTYLAAVDRQLPMPADEKVRHLAKLRSWAEADDGAPVYMLNLMRYYDELRRFPGAPDFAGTPEQSNEHYERLVKPMLLKSGAYPLFSGRVRSANVLDAAPELDHWSRVLVVRYPTRRAFLELLSDPAYAPIEPYKFMALQVALVPVAAEAIIPDLRLLAGGLLLALYLAVGWARAARRHDVLRDAHP